MIANLKGSYETVEYRDASSLQLYDNDNYEAYPRHWHTCIEIIMPTRGEYTLDYDNRRVCLKEKDILLLCPGALHTLDACAGERYIFQAEMAAVTQLQSISSLLTILYPGIVITPENSPETYGRLYDLFMKIVDEYHHAQILYEAVIYGYLLEIMAVLRRGHETIPKPIGVSGSKQKEYLDKFTEVCNYINDHCTEDLTLDSVAAVSGFSKYHFSRLFKQFTNVSFYRYLNQKRIENAERLLASPEMSVTSVSLSSGFSSLSSFIRMFKLIKGCTPSEYRAMYNL